MNEHKWTKLWSDPFTGNLTNDGLRSFAYDDENQLIQVWVANQWFSQFTYDGKMRRRIRQEFTWQSSGWVQTNEVFYVYDGNVVIQERNVNNLPSTTYTRGKDLSRSLQGAGGIGGLLSMTLNTQPGPSSSNSYYYHADGNGNVTMLINPSQYIVAKYLYDVFGNVLSAAGSLAQQNLYRFSSKEAHLNSGLDYYLYRYYDPNLQRWPNRDPVEEIAFQNQTSTHSRVNSRRDNLFCFLENSPLSNRDNWGLLVFHGCTQKEQDQIKKTLGDQCAKAKHCALMKCDTQGPNHAMDAICDGNRDYGITCAGSDDKQCSGNCGYADLGSGKITLCPDAWSKCQGGLGCTIFHEALHASGSMEHKDPDFKKFQDCMGCEDDYSKN